MYNGIHMRKWLDWKLTWVLSSHQKHYQNANNKLVAFVFPHVYLLQDIFVDNLRHTHEMNKVNHRDGKNLVDINIASQWWFSLTSFIVAKTITGACYWKQWLGSDRLRETCKWGKDMPCAMTTTKGRPEEQIGVILFFSLSQRWEQMRSEHAQHKNTAWSHWLKLIRSQQSLGGKGARCLLICTVLFVKSICVDLCAIMSLYHRFTGSPFGYS